MADSGTTSRTDPTIEDAVVISEEPIVSDSPQPAGVPGSYPIPDPAATRRRGGFAALVLGGAIAAALGFGAAHYVPLLWPPTSDSAADTVALALAEQASRSDKLAADLATLTESVKAQPDAGALAKVAETMTTLQSDLTGQISAAQAALETISQSVGALDSRLAALERRPAAAGTVTGADLASVEADLTTLRTQLDTQLARADSALTGLQTLADQTRQQLDTAAAGAEASARSVGVVAALQRVQTALDSGSAFGGALDALAAYGVTVSDPLRAQQDGVQPLRTLQQSFAEPARAALDASLKATVRDGAMDRVTAFFRTQLGARSLEPQNGTDPDAILSRAEAALQNGDLTTTLAEIAQLPAEGQAALAGWSAAAQTRLGVQQAVTAIADSLNK